MKDKIEVEMLSPLMAEFIPDYSDIVDLDDAEPLEGPDLVQYQTSIAEKVDEINRLGMPDNQPCNLIDYFDRNKDIKEKVERITMAVKEQEGVLYGCANLTWKEKLIVVFCPTLTWYRRSPPDWRRPNCLPPPWSRRS